MLDQEPNSLNLCGVTENAETFSMMGYSSNIYTTSYRNVMGGEHFKVTCTPKNANNLWENFLLAKDYGNLAIKANDTSVGKYVTKINATTFEVTIPADCRAFLITHTIADGYNVSLIIPDGDIYMKYED